jgi:hypothetical protein
LQLSQLATQKAHEVSEIEKDFEHDGFHRYSLIDYRKALDSHSDAVNLHGKIVSDMVREEKGLNDEYEN